jgi:pyruvate/2-oxoacid:ferredoxin oxidoreductase alpha subunit
MEKAISLGSGGPLATEVRSLFQGRRGAPRIISTIAGLGGRDITATTIRDALSTRRDGTGQAHFLELNPELELEGVSQKY